MIRLLAFALFVFGSAALLYWLIVSIPNMHVGWVVLCIGIVVLGYVVFKLAEWMDI